MGKCYFVLCVYFSFENLDVIDKIFECGVGNNCELRL